MTTTGSESSVDLRAVQETLAAYGVVIDEARHGSSADWVDIRVAAPFSSLLGAYDALVRAGWAARLERARQTSVPSWWFRVGPRDPEAPVVTSDLVGRDLPDLEEMEVDPLAYARRRWGVAQRILDARRSADPRVGLEILARALVDARLSARGSAPEAEHARVERALAALGRYEDVDLATMQPQLLAPAVPPELREGVPGPGSPLEVPRGLTAEYLDSLVALPAGRPPVGWVQSPWYRESWVCAPTTRSGASADEVALRVAQADPSLSCWVQLAGRDRYLVVVTPRVSWPDLRASAVRAATHALDEQGQATGGLAWSDHPRVAGRVRLALPSSDFARVVAARDALVRVGWGALVVRAAEGLLPVRLAEGRGWAGGDGRWLLDVGPPLPGELLVTSDQVGQTIRELEVLELDPASYVHLRWEVVLEILDCRHDEGLGPVELRSVERALAHARLSVLGLLSSELARVEGGVQALQRREVVDLVTLRPASDASAGSPP